MIHKYQLYKYQYYICPPVKKEKNKSNISDPKLHHGRWYVWAYSQVCLRLCIFQWCRGQNGPITDFWHLYIVNECFILTYELQVNTLCAISHGYMLYHCKRRPQCSRFTGLLYWFRWPWSTCKLNNNNKNKTPAAVWRSVLLTTTASDHRLQSPDFIVEPMHVLILCKLKLLQLSSLNAYCVGTNT